MPSSASFTPLPVFSTFQTHSDASSPAPIAASTPSVAVLVFSGADHHHLLASPSIHCSSSSRLRRPPQVPTASSVSVHNNTNPPHFPANSIAKSFVDLILKPSDKDTKIWPHSYEFRLRVAPGGALILTLRIRNTNTDGKPFSFTFAYQTYFSVSDISEVRVEGLETLDYLDNLKEKERFTEQGETITFESEVDKIYLSTPIKIAILDHEKKRTFVLLKDGLPDAVVWNPWDKKGKALADFGYDEYKHILCVEAAAIEKPTTLQPGQEWKGTQELSTVPSSYCSGQLDPQKVLQG